MKSNLEAYPHRRYNILTKEWVLVSPHRTSRPWQGKTETFPKKEKISHDPGCYLCPTNKRINGSINDNYKNTNVFTNDFGALLNDTPHFNYKKSLLLAEGESGICKVIIFSPNHCLTIPDMEIADLIKVVETWQNEYVELGSLPNINYV